MAFVKAQKYESKLRLAITGPSGAGKTYTALSIAKHLPGPLALRDTDPGSASTYPALFHLAVLRWVGLGFLASLAVAPSPEPTPAAGQTQ